MEAKVNLKELPPKQRMSYIWDYYKVWIIGGIFILYSIISSIYQYITAKDCLLTVTMLNGYVSITEPVYADDYLTARGYDTDEYELKATSVTLEMTDESIAEDYNTVQSLIARLTSGSIDIFSAPQDIFEPYAEEGYFLNLEEVFTEAELSKYEDFIVYDIDPTTNKEYPCGFDFTDNAWILTHGYYTDSCYFGILYNSSNLDQAKDFLSYILDYS